MFSEMKKRNHRGHPQALVRHAGHPAYLPRASGHQRRYPYPPAVRDCGFAHSGPDRVPRMHYRAGQCRRRQCADHSLFGCRLDRYGYRYRQVRRQRPCRYPVSARRYDGRQGSQSGALRCGLPRRSRKMLSGCPRSLRQRRDQADERRADSADG